MEKENWQGRERGAGECGRHPSPRASQGQAKGDVSCLERPMKQGQGRAREGGARHTWGAREGRGAGTQQLASGSRRALAAARRASPTGSRPPASNQRRRGRRGAARRPAGPPQPRTDHRAGGRPAAPRRRTSHATRAEGYNWGPGGRPEGLQGIYQHTALPAGLRAWGPQASRPAWHPPDGPASATPNRRMEAQKPGR